MKHLSTQAKSRLTTLISIVIIAILIPLTYLFSYLLGDRQYYIASVIIMILAMVPLFVSFEGERPDARRLSTLAVMTAISVVSRIAFMWLPSFKPMGGFVMITGMAFGPQAGFLCGALSMIVSNILFGQGPWTPWQMFCYGLIGLAGGLFAKIRLMSEKHAIRSAVTTLLTVFVLSGLVLDTCSVFLMTTVTNWASALAVYVSGIPFNVGNAVCSALCVLLLIKPLMAILNRLKLKYGIHFK